MQRMREKLAEYAAEGAPWPHSAAILDPVRLSIVCSGPSQIVQTANWFIAGPKISSNGEKELPDLRVKNKFAFAPEELKGGYRDLMLSVLYEDRNSNLCIIGEIQVFHSCYCLTLICQLDWSTHSMISAAIIFVSHTRLDVQLCP